MHIINLNHTALRWDHIHINIHLRTIKSGTAQQTADRWFQLYQTLREDPPNLEDSAPPHRFRHATKIRTTY